MHNSPSFRVSGYSDWTERQALIRPAITLHIVLHTQYSNEIVLLECQLPDFRYM
jgi:hypothetical protein